MMPHVYRDILDSTLPLLQCHFAIAIMPHMYGDTLDSTLTLL